MCFIGTCEIRADPGSFYARWWIDACSDTVPPCYTHNGAHLFPGVIRQGAQDTPVEFAGQGVEDCVAGGGLEGNDHSIAHVNCSALIIALPACVAALSRSCAGASLGVPGQANTELHIQGVREVGGEICEWPGLWQGCR